MKKFISIFTVLSIVFSMFGTFTVFADETAEDITEISTLAELEKFRDSVNEGNTYEGKTVKLTADIEASSKYGEYKNVWTPIGIGDGSFSPEAKNVFAGTFDGGGHLISNIYIYYESETSSYTSAGFFGIVTGTVKNLTVEGEYTNLNGWCTGGIAAGSFGRIEQCAFIGEITCQNNSGGIVGGNGGTIENCYNTASVITYNCGGGIAGSNDGGTITRCYNMGRVYTGGVFDDIEDEYKWIGSICVGAASSVTDCYYLTGTCERGVYTFSDEDGGTELTLEQFADKSNFNNWDFDSVWEMDANLGRPVLRSNKKSVEEITEISNAEELKAFADSVNNGNTYEGKIVTLKADIDLSSVCGTQIGETDLEVSWTPIGDDSPFNGTFDGNGHTISGLYINSVYSDGAGLFGFCDENSQILNLVVDGSVTVGYPSMRAVPPSIISGIVGASLGKIANCHNKATITGIGNGVYAAGICGMGIAVENCINTGYIISEYESEAIIAFGDNSCNDNCYYLEGTSVHGNGAMAKTAEQFASGEVAYLLGDTWGQKIGVDDYPVIGGDKVYYSNGEYTNTPSTTMEVTVPPPDVDTESGVVQYGTKVTISPAHGLRFRYSVNGEEFENPDASNVVITITEDTELLVQSIVDDKEPGVAYLCNTETYMYHLQKYGRIAGKCSPAGASLSLYDSEGNKIDSTIADEEGNYAFENVPPGTGYMLSVFKYGYIVVTYDDITVTAEETVIMNVGAVLGDYTVIITDAQEFKEFADNVNNGQTYEHYEIILDNDIDISTICGEDIDGEEVSWTPIGSEEHPFKGSFSGCGHTVSGLYINTDNESQYLGLFGYAGEKSRITTLTVDGSVEVLGTTYMRPPAASQYQYVGAITGYSAGYISGCHNKAEVYFSGNCGGVGGIAGKLIGENALITGCSNTGNVSAQFTVYGGIAGRVNNHASVTSCYSTGYNMLIETPAKIAASIEMDNGASAEKCYYLAEAEAESDIPGIYAKTTGQFASGEVAYLLGSPWGQKIGVDEYPVYGGDKVYLTDEGYTNTPPTEIHVHKICGDETCPDNHEDITWTAWDSADKLPTEAGNYYLTKDVEISGTWVPADGTNLCLNSHSIIQIDHNRSVISVQGEFSICDCSGIGKITGGYSGVVVASSTFNMYSGEITGNHSTGDVFDGAGVLVLNNGIFNMHGGKISQNTSEIGGIGGGVLCYPDSTFNMSGGEISGNTAGNGGGVSIEINAKMNISGNVVIKDNENAKGETSNVHLVEKSKRITISAPLSDGAYIGVNSTVSPSDGNPVDITDENSADYSGYFHSDSEDYTIVNGDNNVVKLCVRIPTEFSITYHEGEYLVSAPEAGTYTAIIAEYAYDGTLESVTSEEVTFDTPGTKRVFHAKKPGLAYMTKLMLWYGFENMEPCCQSKTVITLVD